MTHLVELNFCYLVQYFFRHQELAFHNSAVEILEERVNGVIKEARPFLLHLRSVNFYAWRFVYPKVMRKSVHTSDALETKGKLLETQLAENRTV